MLFSCQNLVACQSSWQVLCFRHGTNSFHEVMKLFVRYSLCFVTTVFIAGLIIHNQYYKAKELENNSGKTQTIGRYVHPFNSSIQGIKEFRFSEHAFKLFKRLTYELEAGVTVNNISITSYTRHLKPVTAVSSNHFIELMGRIDIMAKFMPTNVSVVVYDLGLNEYEIKTLRNMAFVDYRIFDFSVYPDFIRHLGNYAWKPLIFQKMLSEYGGVLWMDSSIIFHESYEKIVRYMVEKKSSFLYYFRRAGHTIVSGTEPRMLEFLPMRGAKQMTNRMPQAGGILAFNTELVRRDIMKWVLACSLLEQCISPSGSTQGCGDNFPPDRFGGCHLFDQSLFSIIVSNAHASQEEKYTLPEEMLGFAYPWRIRSDNLLLCSEFVTVYIIWAVIITLIISLRCKYECLIGVKYLSEFLSRKFLTLCMILALTVGLILIFVQ